ncbi:hypothetical protein SAMN05444972_11183 [Marininema halotolerans]|uniref:Uncharacterized protein n=1 Tax=Marininema halotolerans TaxID=1155944 RepID=A0A1I6TUK3_9BACL|nr:hypothetical protein SAMN05444972_11183 [Marininema halotolerans]
MLLTIILVGFEIFSLLFVVQLFRLMKDMKKEVANQYMKTGQLKLSDEFINYKMRRLKMLSLVVLFLSIAYGIVGVIDLYR